MRRRARLSPPLPRLAQMASRAVYTALTPEVSSLSFPPSAGAGVTFVPAHSHTPSEPDAEGFLLAPAPKGPVKLFVHEICARWRALKASTLAVVKNNTGLLLVAASQFFFALVNVAVKKLNTLDTPVPTLEVSQSLL